MGYGKIKKLAESKNIKKKNSLINTPYPHHYHKRYRIGV